MHCAVTGGTGLVGYHIARALLRHGHGVRLLARSPEKARRLFGGDPEVVQGDVTDPESLPPAFRGCEWVFHAAGLPEQWLPDPARFTEVNVLGTANVVAACREVGVVRLVHVSTIDVFRAGEGESFDEDDLDPEPKGTPYERSKQEADRLVASAVAEGMNAVLTHPAAVYGPGPAGSPGVNQFLVDVRDGKVPAVPPGGFPVVFGPDLGEGHVQAAARAERGARFIFSDRYASTLELARLVAEQTACRVPPRMPRWLAHAVSAATEAGARLVRKPPLLPAGQLHFLLWGAQPSSDRARRELGWRTTPLAEGIAQTLAAT